MGTVDVTVPKVRSRADKIGKHKYELELLHRLDKRMERIEHMQRIIFQGLGDYFHFDRPLVEKVAIENEKDLDVVSRIYESGGAGILAKQIVAELASRYPRLERHMILRIVNRVNRNMCDAFGKPIIEKQGKKWFFTLFGLEIWGKTEEDDEEEA